MLAEVNSLWATFVFYGRKKNWIPPLHNGSSSSIPKQIHFLSFCVSVPQLRNIMHTVQLVAIYFEILKCCYLNFESLVGWTIYFNECKLQPEAYPKRKSTIEIFNVLKVCSVEIFIAFEETINFVAYRKTSIINIVYLIYIWCKRHRILKATGFKPNTLAATAIGRYLIFNPSSKCLPIFSSDSNKSTYYFKHH